MHSPENMNMKERMLYEARRKAQIDALYFLQTPEQFEEIGRKKGREEGVIEGRVEGKIEGKTEGQQFGLIQGKILSVLELKFGELADNLALEITRIESIDRLQALLELAKKCPTLDQFEQKINLFKTTP